MNQLNSILIEGNMVNDPEFETTEKGTPFCKFCIASTRYTRITDADLEGRPVGEREVSFFDIETWKVLAETCKKYGKKGRGVRVVGRMKQGRGTDGLGSHQERTLVVAGHVAFKPEFSRTKKASSELLAAAKALNHD